MVSSFTGRQQTWRNVAKRGTKVSEEWWQLIATQTAFPLQSHPCFIIALNYLARFKILYFFANWLDLWRHLLTQSIKTILGRIGHNLTSTLILILYLCHWLCRHSKRFTHKLMPFSLNLSMGDKNAGMYYVPPENSIFWIFFLSQACVHLGHNNMNLTKLISKIRNDDIP